MYSETPKKYTEKLLSEALGGMYSRGEITVLPTVELSIPEAAFGDLSTNIALKMAKAEKKNPKDLAEKIIREIKVLDKAQNFASIEQVSGFINITLSSKYLLENMSKVLELGDLYGYSLIGGGKVVVVEYFQNNVAKPPHVGHLRSAVIGDCLLRIFKSQGYKTISDTHIGDWGVQFGILLFAYKEFIKQGGDKNIIENNSIEELNKLYVSMSAQIEANPELRDLGKQEFVKLEQGNTENRELWQWFVRVSLEDFEHYRKLLYIFPFDHNLGESFYEDKMPSVLAEFESKGLVSIGESGEKYVDLEAFSLGRCILIKSDGGTTYHLRDFATYIYRKKEFNFYKNIYEVDSRQAHHFRQLFKVLDLAGYPALTDCVHVEHGYMSLPEGAISTRKGTTISLDSLLAEAEKRALQIIEEKNPTLENKEAVAQLVALGAIKYFDLSHNRKSEIVFTWEHALSFEGNTGPYLQYTHARIYGILRKANSHPHLTSPIKGEETDISAGVLKEHELIILRNLSNYPELLHQVTQDFLPNALCNYLFELSQSFNSFYAEVPVIGEKDEKLKELRLKIITATAQVIKNGLNLLGIEAPEEM